MMIRIWTNVCAGTLTLLLVFLYSPAGARENLLPDGGFEGQVGVSWRTYTPRLGPVIETTATHALEGELCLGIAAESDLIGLAVSEPATEVAPGECFTMKVSCRTEGVKSDTGGGLAFGAAFVNRAGRAFWWDRATPPAANDGKWHELSHDVVVPDGASQMMFQVGLRRARGQSWWDAASLESSAPVALRIDAPTSGISFGQTTLSATLLKRHSKMMPSIHIRTQPGDHTTFLRLDGGTSQNLELPFTFDQRGKQSITAEVVADARLFFTSQTVTISDALTVEPLIPTHWVVEDSGQPRFEAEVEVNVEASTRRDAKLSCTVRNSSGVIVAERPTTPLPPANPVKIEMQVDGSKSAPVGDYNVTFRLERDGVTIASVEEPWHIIHRGQAQTTVSPDGYPVVDGKKVFPLALYMGDPTRFEEMREAGFNVTQSYPAFAGPGSSNRTAKTFLDQAHAAGLKTLTFVTHGGDRLPDDEALKRIRTFRNHPATFVWYQEEVLARGYKPMSYLEALVGMLRREAPNFPILQGDQRDESSRMIGQRRWFPDEYMDFGTWWWYPTPLRETPSMENYEGDASGPEKEYKPPKFLTDNGTTKPIWMAVQCYAKPGQSDARFPTPEEYRCHAYLSICHGGKGLLYYTGLGERGQGVLSRPEEGHWDYLKKLVGELRDMSPVFMSADADMQPELVTSGTLVSTRLKRMEDGRWVMLAVNRSIVPTTAEWQVPAIFPAAEVKVRYENRSVKANAGKLTDAFKPYEVHIYEW